MALYPPGTNPCGTPATVSVSQSTVAYSEGQYNSQPNSPTKVTRWARHGTGPTLSSFAFMYPNASLEQSVAVRDWSMSRAFGPHKAKHAYFDVTSSMLT